MPDVDRRTEILAAARTIVARDGVEGLTFSALEKSLSVTRGSIVWHFDSKSALERALVEQAVEEIDRKALAAIRGRATLTERARAVVGEMVDGYVGRGEAGAVLLSFVARRTTRTGSDPRAAELVSSLWARYRGYSTELVRIGIERGDFRDDVDADALGALMVALVLGIAMQHLSAPDDLDLPRVVALAGDVIVRHLAC